MDVINSVILQNLRRFPPGHPDVCFCGIDDFQYIVFHGITDDDFIKTPINHFRRGAYDEKFRNRSSRAKYLPDARIQLNVYNANIPPRPPRLPLFTAGFLRVGAEVPLWRDARKQYMHARLAFLNCLQPLLHIQPRRSRSQSARSLGV